MLEEFQIPSEEQYYENQQQQQQQKTMQSTYKDEKEIKELYDPITFFVTVGIAYLGFLEDQEVSNFLCFETFSSVPFLDGALESRELLFL